MIRNRISQLFLTLDDLLTGLSLTRKIYSSNQFELAEHFDLNFLKLLNFQ